MCQCADVDIFIPCPQQVLWLNHLCRYADMNNIIWNILLANFYEYNLFHVDSYKCLWAFIGCYTRFSGLQSSLGITNVNRSHNKPLELIETI